MGRIQASATSGDTLGPLGLAVLTWIWTYVLGYSSAYCRMEDGGILRKHPALGLALLCTPSKRYFPLFVAYKHARAGTLPPLAPRPASL